MSESHENCGDWDDVEGEFLIGQIIHLTVGRRTVGSHFTEIIIGDQPADAVP